MSKRVNNTTSGTVLNLIFHVYTDRGRGRGRAGAGGKVRGRAGGKVRGRAGGKVRGRAGGKGEENLGATELLTNFTLTILFWIIISAFVCFTF